MKKIKLVTILLAVVEDCEDSVSELLSESCETNTPGSGILDWQYVNSSISAEVPDEFGFDSISMGSSATEDRTYGTVILENIPEPIEQYKEKELIYGNPQPYKRKKKR